MEKLGGITITWLSSRTTISCTHDSIGNTLYYGFSKIAETLQMWQRPCTKERIKGEMGAS